MPNDRSPRSSVDPRRVKAIAAKLLELNEGGPFGLYGDLRDLRVFVVKRTTYSLALACDPDQAEDAVGSGEAYHLDRIIGDDDVKELADETQIEVETPGEGWTAPDALVWHNFPDDEAIEDITVSEAFAVVALLAEK